MTCLWQDDRSTYDGEFVSFKDVVALPKPIQKPHPPILIGGESPPALRRAARLGDGWIGGLSTVEQLTSAVERLEKECEAIDRDPGELQRVHMVAFPTPDVLEEHLVVASRLGIDEVVVIVPRGQSASGFEQSIDGIARVGGLL